MIFKFGRLIVNFSFLFLFFVAQLSVLCLVALFVCSFTSTDCVILMVDMAKWSMGDSFFFFFWLAPPLTPDQIKMPTIAEPECGSSPAFTPVRTGWNGMILSYYHSPAVIQDGHLIPRDVFKC